MRHCGVFCQQFLLVGQTALEVGKFCAVQAHAVSPAEGRCGKLVAAFQIGLHHHAHAVAHFRGPAGGLQGQLFPGHILMAAAFVAGQVGFVRVQQHAAAKAVHDDLLVFPGYGHKAGNPRQTGNMQAA